jgi:hypothetical protein
MLFYENFKLRREEEDEESFSRDAIKIHGGRLSESLVPIGSEV